MSAIDFMLSLAGLPQQTIDEIEKASPAAAALLKLANDNQQLIADIVALANKAQPLIAKAMPLINQATAEIKIVLPAAIDVLKFMNQPKPPSNYPDPNQS